VSSDAPARRLLARLADEQAIEIEPIAEVRADLAALGVDPARAVALARRLASGAASSPAAALLDRIAQADDDDEEIRRLEQAELAAVRKRLGAEGAASAVAHAQRAAAPAAKVVPLRRRRRLLYGLSGLAAALAASVVLIIGLSSRQLSYQAPRQVSATPVVAGQPTQSETDSVQARMQPSSNGAAPPAEQQVSRSAAPQLSADAESAVRAKSEADEKAKDVASQPASLADAPQQTAGSVAGQTNEEDLRGGAQANLIAQPFGLDRPVTALLIVDPRLVPADLRQERYPIGNLAARLVDARRLAGGRPIAALVTLRLEDRTADAVVIADVVKESLALRRDLDKTAALPAAPAPTGKSYDIILLDR